MLPAASTLQVQALYIRLFAFTEKLHQGCGPTWSYDGGRMPLFLLDTAALYQLQKAETIWNSTLSGDDKAQIPVTSGYSIWYNAAWYCRFASSWHLDHATCWCFISCLLHSGLMQLKMPCLSRWNATLWSHKEQQEFCRPNFSQELKTSPRIERVKNSLKSLDDILYVCKAGFRVHTSFDTKATQCGKRLWKTFEKTTSRSRLGFTVC